MGPVAAQSNVLKDPRPRVGVIMGSLSDHEVMSDAVRALEELGVAHECTVVSAHRTPHRMMDYAQSARSRGLEVIIAGAGGAAHLPGMVAAVTTLPVIGVPVLSRTSIQGLDSLLSIVQMPPGVPVATVAVNGAFNAGVLAAQILGTRDPSVSAQLETFKMRMKEKSEAMAAQIGKM
jgi:5-(carboxyamino)imidazole ribonucleotide mutase